MLYVFLKYLMRLTLNSYFKVIKVSGEENIPKNGPIIFVSNHPSTLMDPVVIGALVKPELYFLAAAEFMGTGLMQKAMGSFFNMIPIYRPTTQPTKSSKNSDVFRKCYDHLAKKGSILIFPEGRSVTQHRLLPLKTGTARLVIGAEKKTPIKVQIVPIGLNYSDPHSFRSDLYVSIGKPINTDEIELKSIPDDFEKAKVLTQLIEEKLKENLIHLEDEKLDSIFEKIKRVFHVSDLPQMNESTNLEGSFSLNQEIQDGLHYYQKANPKKINEMGLKLDAHLNRLQFYGISNHAISSRSDVVNWKDYARIIFGIPLFLFGFLTNSVPYYSSIWLVRKLNINGSFLGSIGLSIGLIFYLIWYLTLGIVISKSVGVWWVGIVVLVFIYACGIFTLHYMALIKELKQKGQLYRLFRRKRNVYKSLVLEREEIIDEIKKAASFAKENPVNIEQKKPQD